MSPSVSTAPTLSTAKELLARLVAFDTTSPKTNIPLIDFVEAYLAEHGIESRRVPTPDGLKASLFATIGPGDGGGIALSGHTDVVPVASQAWDTDPFQLVERDGKLYGRGTCDMKGYLACCLAMVPELKARRLKVPFHLAFSYDEEVGCTGVRPMIGEFGKTLADAAHGVRRRAQQHDRGRRAQGPGALARGAHGTGGAFEHAALWRQRHHLRRPADRRDSAHGGGAEGRAAQCALRSALDHHAGDADRGRHGLQHRAGAVLVRLGDPRAAGLRSLHAAAAAGDVRGREAACRRCASGARVRDQDPRS